MNVQGPVPPVLRERLGDIATIDLMELLETERVEWSNHVLDIAADRFDRRLTEQVSGVRVELHAGLADIRQEIAAGRVEFLKWSFLFWIGQVAVIAGLLAFMFRLAGR